MKAKLTEEIEELAEKTRKLMNEAADEEARNKIWSSFSLGVSEKVDCFAQMNERVDGWFDHKVMPWIKESEYTLPIWIGWGLLWLIVGLLL